MTIDHSDQVWAVDSTYIRMQQGFIYLVAIMDGYSRYVLSWGISIILDAGFYVDAMKRALQFSQPEIMNTDQGVKFTSAAFIGILEDKDIRISVDGRGRAFDNIFVERLWRYAKDEEVYLHQCTTPMPGVTWNDTPSFTIMGCSASLCVIGHLMKFISKSRLVAMNQKWPWHFNKQSAVASLPPAIFSLCSAEGLLRDDCG